MSGTAAGGGEGLSVSERLVARAFRPAVPADRRRAALHVLDWLGCAFIGRTTLEGRILSADLGGGAPLPLFAPGDPERRAFALGGLGSVFEMDDVHRTGLLHPGPVVVPAALAFGADMPGAALLDAVLAGYEAMVGIGRALGRGHYRFFHPTATCGGFGAAMAAARLTGLGAAEAVSALGNAGSTAGGLFQCLREPVMTKPFHIAEAARRGVAAARWAARGLTGPRFILEGPQGFFPALAPDGDAEAAVAGGDDGAWLIEEVSFKPWPACRHVHAAIDAALTLREQIGGGEIGEVEVETYADAVRICDNPAPKTMHGAKFSLQHAVAVVLANGRPGLADFSPDTLGGPEVAAVRGRVRVRADERFSLAYPRHFGAAVSVRLADGRDFSAEVADAWGDPENPMDEEAVIGKSLMLMEAAGLAPQRAQDAAAAVLTLAEGGSLKTLAALLAPPKT